MKRAFEYQGIVDWGAGAPKQREFPFVYPNEGCTVTIDATHPNPGAYDRFDIIDLIELVTDTYVRCILAEDTRDPRVGGSARFHGLFSVYIDLTVTLKEIYKGRQLRGGEEGAVEQVEED